MSKELMVTHLWPDSEARVWYLPDTEEIEFQVIGADEKEHGWVMAPHAASAIAWGINAALTKHLEGNTPERSEE